MKNRLFKILTAMVVMIGLLASCSTSASIRSLVPSDVNLSAYNNIAVQSTKAFQNLYYWPFSALSVKPGQTPVPATVVLPVIHTTLEQTTAEKTAKEATDVIYSAMDKGFYRMSSPEITDALINAGQLTGNVRKMISGQGIDALVTSEIRSMNFEEYIFYKTENVRKSDNTAYVKYSFYVKQKASLSMSYAITDVEANMYITSGTLEGKNEKDTYIGSTDENGIFKSVYYSLPLASDMFEDIVDDFSSTITSRLTPHYETSYVTLKKNSPKLDSLKAAYDYVESGMYDPALQLFLDTWNRMGHDAAGYNAAVLFSAMGEYNSAMNLAYDVYTRCGDPDALALYYDIKSIQSDQDLAIQQINSTEKISQSKEDELIGF